MIESGAVFAAQSEDVTVAGDWTNSGTFTPGTPQTTTFNGTGAQIISGSTATGFSSLTINNSAGVSLSGVDAAVSGLLTLTNGDLNTGANTLTQTITSTSSGPGGNAGGDVVGNVSRAHIFAPLTGYSFGNQFNTINFAVGGTPPTAITLNLVKSVPNDFTNAVARTYTITPTGGSGFSSTLRLHYLDSELNGNTERPKPATLGKLWRVGRARRYRYEYNGQLGGTIGRWEFLSVGDFRAECANRSCDGRSQGYSLRQSRAARMADRLRSRQYRL